MSEPVAGPGGLIRALSPQVPEVPSTGLSDLDRAALTVSARARWLGPPCGMCRGTGVYPYHPHPVSLTDKGPEKWGPCGACYGHGRDAE